MKTLIFLLLVSFSTFADGKKSLIIELNVDEPVIRNCTGELDIVRENINSFIRDNKFEDVFSVNYVGGFYSRGRTDVDYNEDRCFIDLKINKDYEDTYGLKLLQTKKVNMENDLVKSVDQCLEDLIALNNLENVIPLQLNGIKRGFLKKKLYCYSTGIQFINK